MTGVASDSGSMTSILSRPHVVPAAAVTALLAVLMIFGTTLGGAHPPRSPISVTTVAPVAGQTVSGNVVWQVSTSGSTDHVDFYVDGQKLWTEGYSPYQFHGDPNGTLDTTTLTNGAHDLKAIAYTSTGQSATTAVQVTVANGTRTSGSPPPTPPPTPTSAVQVSISTPADAQVVSGSIPWVAVSSDPKIVSVTFAIDGHVQWTERGAPYYFNGDPYGTLDTRTLTNGVHVLTSTASTSDGRTGAATISINVQNLRLATTSGTPVNTLLPVVTGTPRVGATLTASTGTWAGALPMAYSSRWQRCAAGSCAPITGATGWTYTPTSTDAGLSIGVTVTATNTGGSSTTSSNQTAPITSSTISSYTLGAPTWPNTSEPSYTPNRIATTPAGFNLIISSLHAGDVVEVNPMTISGEVILGAKPSSLVQIHFDPGVKFTGAPSGSYLPAVWIHGSNLALYGGDVTNRGNDCVRVQAASADSSGVTNVRWWGATIHDCAGTGFAVQGTGYPNSGLDIAAEIWHAGQDLSLDPHAEKGTGLHGAYLGGGTTTSSGRFMLDVHDQPTGAAVQVGANLQNSQLWVQAQRITFQAVTQVAGNAVQLWGGNNRNVTVEDVEADSLAGRVIETDALDGGSGLSVLYARGTNTRLAPYALGSYVTCVSCA